MTRELLIAVAAPLALCLSSFAADLGKLQADLRSDNGQVVLAALKELKSLGPSGAPAEPAIVALLKAKKNYPWSDYGLDNVVYPTAFETLKAVGARSDDALHVSLDYFQNSSDFLGAKLPALDVVAGFGPKAAPAVPLLAAALEKESPRRGGRGRFIAVLEKIGPAASAAVPALLNAAGSGGPDALAAFSALNRIAPSDRRALKAYADAAWRRPRSSEDLKVYDLFSRYLAGCGALDRGDLTVLAGFMDKFVARESAETRNPPGHLMSPNPSFMSAARLFLSSPESADLVMPALAERLRQLDVGTKEFPLLLDLAGDFGAKADSLAPAIYDRAASRERHAHGFLKPRALKTLERIGTPAAAEKARELAALR